MERPLRYIIVGTGGFGARWCRDFLPRLTGLGKAAPAAAVDLDAGALANAREGLGLPPFPVREEGHVGGRLENLYLGFDRTGEQTSPGPVTLWFTVDDLGETFDRFAGLGAKVRREPAERPWGDRIAAVEDPEGNLLGLAQRR